MGENLEGSLKEIEANLDQTHGCEAADDDDGFFCVACDKFFRSDKAFANHEKSKKHKENVQLLKELMLEEEEGLDGPDGSPLEKAQTSADDDDTTTESMPQRVASDENDEE